MSNPNVLSGRKRTVNKDNWKRNISKKSRNEGKEYISSSSGKKVSAKQFEAPTSCCSKKCFLKIESKHQEKLYNRFWELGDYTAQNVFLSTLFKDKKPAKADKYDDDEDSEAKAIRWVYYFPRQFQANDEFIVCEKFLTSIIGIKRARLRTVQLKIKNNLGLRDNRGRSNHFVKLTDELKQLIHEHCASLPHTKSNHKNTKLNYFTDKSLTLKSLYERFVEYYKERTGSENSPLAESTYSKYFNCYVNFSIGASRPSAAHVSPRVKKPKKEQEQNMLWIKEETTETVPDGTAFVSCHENVNAVWIKKETPDDEFGTDDSPESPDVKSDFTNVKQEDSDSS